MSYDSWKTRSPDAVCGEDEPTELDMAYADMEDAKGKAKRCLEVANGLYGLLQLIFNRPDVSDDLRDVIANNHRAVDAGNYLQPDKRLEWPKF